VRWLGRLGLSLASLALCFALIEAGARSMLASLEGGQNTAREPVTRYHPLLGWDKPPSSEHWLRRPEYRTHVVFNSHGLRGPERDYAKPAGVRRVLLLGDSFTEGYTVPEPETVRARLEDLLGAGGARAEVINAGTHGYGVDQEYIYYEIEGRRYAPDTVVVLFCYNDVAQTTDEDPGRPWFVVEAGGLALKNSPVPEPEVTQSTPRPFRLMPWRGSVALRLLSQRTSQGNPALHRRLSALGLVEPYSDQEIPEAFWPYGPTHRPLVNEMWRRTTPLLRALKASVERDGARLLLFYIPCRFELNERAWALTRERYRLGDGWDTTRLRTRLAAVCRQLGIEMIEPTARYREAEAAGRLAYLPGDGHWTALGHAIAAEAIAGGLR